ncbi:MAG: ion channel DMI1, partial [Candidatus Eisenbacteria bacterium]|nr:ion channel DMI1 [Candidatus Eisenbacteria bacterium]
MARFLNRLKFQLETYLVRGAHFQLLAVAGMIGIISVAAGLLAWISAPVGEGKDESIWWAFLRLTDPGYLGDDVGLARRVISTGLTVLGYVLFMGSLVAILTQWLNRTLKQLEEGYILVVRRNHLLILGWSTSTGIVVADLLRSQGRVRRFLRRQGSRSLHIVILAERVGSSLVQELKERTDEYWNPRQITLRSGSALRRDHLERVDYTNAAAILVPAGPSAGDRPEAVDTHTIKALLSMNQDQTRRRTRLPLVVAELLDARKLEVARRAYRGPIEVLAGDAIVSRLLAQNVRHPGLSRAYTEILTHGDGNELYVRELPELTGATFEEMAARFGSAILMGVVRESEHGFQPLLNPAPGLRLERNDRLVFLARDYSDTEPDRGSTRAAVPRKACANRARAAGLKRRILILGWSHRAPALLSEFASYREDTFEITVVSSIPIPTRKKALARYEIDPEQCRITLLEADYTVPVELSAIGLEGFDHILILGSDWLRSGEESDARTIVGCLLLEQLLKDPATRPKIVIELLDPENAGLLGTGLGEVLISPVILSHMLAQVTLRRELNSVFAELFTAGGAEITFESLTDYPLPSETTTFEDLEGLAHGRGEIALGL